MNYPLITATALLLTSSVAMGAPTVTGNTISWPDDGWWEVQGVNDDGFIEVCQGGRSCEVSPGEYIVINHSTGVRFEGVFVTGSPNTESVSVTGNVISWPDGGWYQVQDELTYTEICGGTRSCTVDPGSYVVINHTTGERFRGITVEQDVLPESPITVTGNTISWPNDGWYQVQNAVTFDSLCEGGLSCEVVSGIYTAINHTTGIRFENIVVADDGLQEPFPEGESIVSALGYERVLELAEFWLKGGDLSLLGDTISTVEYFDTATPQAVDVNGESTYLCPDGGSNLAVPNDRAPNDGYTFTNCSLEGLLANGEY